MNTPKTTNTPNTKTKKWRGRILIERVNRTKVSFADAIERLRRDSKWVARVHLYRKCKDVSTKTGKLTCGASDKMIESNGYVDMPVCNEREVERQIVDLLRGGFEVRLFNGSLRIYHLVNNDGKLTLGAQVLKDSKLAKAMKSVKIECFRGDESVDISFLRKFADDCREEARKEAKEAAKSWASPDTMVTCPKCGNTFRVGQKLCNCNQQED